jgi:hypothetical protein
MDIQNWKTPELLQMNLHQIDTNQSALPRVQCLGLLLKLSNEIGH